MKKRKDGRYAKQVTIGVKNGKPIKKTVYGKTTKEVEKNYRELMLLVDRGLLCHGDNLTLEELTKEWYRIKKLNKAKANTELAYSSVLKSVYETMGYMKIKDISPYIVEENLNKIQYGENHGRKAELYLFLLNSIFTYGLQQEYIHRNPCTGLLVKAPKQKKRALNQNEKNLISSCSLPIREYTILYLLRYTGIRRGELFALTKKDINRKELTITINKTLIDNDYLFLNRNGKFCTSCTMQNTIKKTAKMTGLGEDISYHTFRHNFISECYIAGVSVKKLQQWVGHTDISTTLNIYTHLDKDTIKDGSEMNSYYSGSQTPFDTNPLTRQSQHLQCLS